MIVGICKVCLFLPGCRSLKEKRSVLRKVKDKFFSKYKILLAEVEDMDLWQKATLGFAVVGNDKRTIEGLMEKAVNFLEFKDGAQVIDRMTEFINC